jgi:cold shock protein
MTNGTVRRVVEKHGYGFLGNNSGKDIFFHYSQLDGVKFQALKEGQNVTYKVALGSKGLEARDIRLLKLSY